MRKLICLIIFFQILLLTACSLFQSEVGNVTDMLPRESDVPGWVRIDKVYNYKGRNIKKYNSEYEGIGIEKLAASTYQSIENRDLKIKLEVIRFNSTLDSYGFYSLKRGHGIFENSQTNEFSSDSISIIQLGEYVIYSTTEQTESMIKKDLRTFSDIPILYIGQNYSHDKLPDSINILKGADGYGILYSRKPLNRFPYIGSIFFTRWTWNKEIVDLYFSENDSFYDSYEIFKKSIDSSFIVINSDNVYTAFKKDQDNKYSFISVNGKWILGCWSVSDINEGKKVLSEIVSRLEDYKKNINN